MNGATATDDARHGNRHVSPNIRVRDLRGSSVCTRDDRSSVSCIYRFGGVEEDRCRGSAQGIIEERKRDLSSLLVDHGGQTNTME